MTGLDLRPLTLGEILDRTFSLYRSHFPLFLGIAGIPQILVLAVQLPQMALQQYYPERFGLFNLTGVLLQVVILAVSVVAYLFSQGGTVIAISEIYLGRSITIGEALPSASAVISGFFSVSPP